MHLTLMGNFKGKNITAFQKAAMSYSRTGVYVEGRAGMSGATVRIDSVALIDSTVNGTVDAVGFLSEMNILPLTGFGRGGHELAWPDATRSAMSQCVTKLRVLAKRHLGVKNVAFHLSAY